MQAFAIVTIVNDDGTFEVWEYDFDQAKDAEGRLPFLTRLDAMMKEAEANCDDYIRLHGGK